MSQTALAILLTIFISGCAIACISNIWYIHGKYTERRNSKPSIHFVPQGWYVELGDQDEGGIHVKPYGPTTKTPNVQ